MTHSNKYKTTQDMLGISGQHLLESGMFADVKVICAERTWDIHKSIICTRCPYFQKAFGGDFEEAKTGKLILRDQLPNEVDWVIKFLYSGKVPHEFIQIQSTRSYIDLFKIADYFDVPCLGEEACTRLRAVLATLARKITSAGKHFLKEPTGWLSDRDLGDFFYAAKTACETGSSSFAILQEPVQGLLTKTRFVIGKDSRFAAFLDGVPGLAVDLVKLLMQSDSQGAKSLVVTDPPASCHDCKRKFAIYAYTWIVTTNDRAMIYGRCEKCEAEL
ncbi:hypothetical protein BJ170DRAFT_720572 [Xylariales sp. AK1849]|nr:hypothetical protein BJ170DRAFT_720572 [Xylariales sp. AK1849]